MERSDEARSMRKAHSNGSRDQNMQVWDMTQTRKKIKVREKRAESREEEKAEKKKKERKERNQPSQYNK